MDNFFVITNKEKDEGLKLTGHIADYLKEHGKKCYISEDYRADVNGDDRASRYMYDIPMDVDCCIVLGGDGTMLQAAHNVVGRDIPLLGVNLGTLGFLTEVETGSIDDALAQLLSGRFSIERRMMIRGEINRDGNVEYALNDIVITRRAVLQVISFNIYVNDKLLHIYHADGVIVSTPTGSTGYSMSAGGPIVEPGAQMLLLTPICPHDMTPRSIVLSPDDKVTVEICEGKGGRRQQIEASFDARLHKSVSDLDKVEIKRADMMTSIIRLNQISFLELLHRKLI